MKIIVQKYGGTSVNTAKSRSMIIKNMIDAIDDGFKPIIVVSAMGRKPEPYATDSLLSLLPDMKKANLRNKDLLATCGEIITTVVVSEEIRAKGINARALTGGQAGIVTNENYGDGKIVNIDTNRLMELLNQDVVPVVAGFQGMSKSGQILTLGRGGSDITATALGAALNADLVEIYTDVDGVMTADPRVVENAELIETVDYDEVFQLAEYGAKVIHPRAVEYAMKADVPIAILNTQKGRYYGGTRIEDVSQDIYSEKNFSAVTQIDGCSQVDIKFTDLKKEDRLFDLLAEKEISIDMINIFPDRKTFIIDTDKQNVVDEVMSKIGLEYTICDGFTKITIMGRMKGVPGVVAKIIAALYSNNIFVHQSSDSSTTVSVLVDTKQAKDAVNVLHTNLIK
ncbi:aspartate kinase [Anaerofustis stercorihominis]|uniref:Aspartokinase n=1 Tax=Anaerofustis stercorihominis TaxID=214853 RepID=A0A3E3DXA4_9FIRM|nr:aspartate kinase [Anaerofustis stercorihominis]MCR2032260.1 aspartate kinase [Anaerofustis stercorihominis]RGD73338.1 aspartate kinase [Anaerofustis stercorihominis]